MFVASTSENQAAQNIGIPRFKISVGIIRCRLTSRITGRGIHAASRLRTPIPRAFFHFVKDMDSRT